MSKSLTPTQTLWWNIFSLTSSQREGYGYCLGSIKHDVLWINLKNFGLKGDEYTRAFRNIVQADSTFIKYETEANKKRTAKQAEKDPAKNIQQFETKIKKESDGSKKT